MDIFCQIKTKLKDQIINQTKNFYVLHDGCPLLEGHLLIIPKKHIDCFLTLEKKLKKEFYELKNKTTIFLRDNYKQLVIFEHGVVGQTIPHAHLHLLPTNKLIIDKLNKFGKIDKKPSIPYLYFGFKNKKNYYKPYRKIIPGLLHSVLYADLLGMPRNGSERNKFLPKWLLNVKHKFKLWKGRN